MSDSKSGLVSVVIPTRNRLEFLERALGSVRAQTWPHVEVIVVDDASNDGTHVFLQAQAAAAPGLLFIRNESSGGGSAARNSGLQAAHGEYVAFLDDDDIWLPEKLERQVSLLESVTSASAVSCSFLIKRKAGKPLLRTLRSPDLPDLLRSNCLGGASMCLARRSVLRGIGGFDRGLRSGQDWDLWIRLADVGTIVVCAEPLVVYVPHDGERITTSVKSAYLGRRRIYFRYRKRMSRQDRMRHLAELGYCRYRLYARGVWSFRGLARLFRRSGAALGARFVYRLLKLQLRGA